MGAAQGDGDTECVTGRFTSAWRWCGRDNMNENCLQDYIFLAFRLHRATQAACGSPFVEEYCGPSAWREQVEAEPETAATDSHKKRVTDGA
jgi:hypothetical protein